MTKEDLYREIFEQMGKQSPSHHFVAGSVFDITRQQHSTFERIVRSHDVRGLLQFFSDAYTSFCNNPKNDRIVSPNLVQKSNNDTYPEQWNADIVDLQNGDEAVLCFMPILNNELDARIIGIVVSEKGDAYYYSMLNQNEASDVMRNKMMQGVVKVGEVQGRGFELMNSFVDCMKRDYYSSAAVQNLSSRHVYDVKSAPRDIPGVLARIKSTAPQHNGLEIQVGEKPVVIGRAADCGLRFANDTKGISRHHCSVAWNPVGNNFIVEDLGSSFGTFLSNGMSIEPHKQYLLPAGESIFLSDRDNTIQLITLPVAQVKN